MRAYLVQVEVKPITEDLSPEDRERAPIGKFYFDVEAGDLEGAKREALRQFNKRYSIKVPGDFEIVTWIEV